MKYIVIDNNGMDDVILFPPWRKHDEMVLQLSVDVSKVVSAGFVKCDDAGHLYCYGESVSLRVKSRKEDTDLITRQLNFECY